MALPRHQPSTLWLLSFGDLVTLLLCFFVFVLAGTMQRQGLLGTTLAISPSNPVQNEAGQSLKLEQEMFSTDGAVIHPDGLKVLEVGMNRWVEQGSGVTVRGCIGPNEPAQSDAWLVSTSRVLVVTRQLIDAGFRRNRITAEPVSNCEPVVVNGVVIDFEAAQ